MQTAIHTDYDWVQTHRRLQVRALERERKNKENSFLLRGKDLQEAELQHATNTSKEPYLTDLQREYVFKSRKAVEKQRRIITGISIAGIIALAMLAIFGFVQAKLATDKANIALAHQLATQGQTIFSKKDSKQQFAVLLAIQSMRMFPAGEAAQILQNNVLAESMAYTTHDFDVTFIDFSLDGKYVISGSRDNTARVWEAETGKEIARMTYEEGVTSTVFSPDGKYVAWLFQSRLTNLRYVIARRFLPKQSPLKRVKLINMEIASSHRTLLAKTFPDLGKAMNMWSQGVATNGALMYNQ